jgi:hypothetical protein
MTVVQFQADASLSIHEAIEALILIWEASTAEEWINQIMSIPF